MTHSLTWDSRDGAWKVTRYETDDQGETSERVIRRSRSWEALNAFLDDLNHTVRI